MKIEARILCEGTEVALSPNSDKVYVGKGYEGAYITDLRGSAMLKIHERGFRAQWSPDGEELAISTGHIYAPSIGPGLLLVDHEGKNKRFIAKLELINAHVQWSPDGKKLLVSDDNLGLHLVNRDGSNLIRLTSDTTFAGASWSPDSRRIAYCDCEQNSANLMLLDINTLRKEKLRSHVFSSILWKPFTDQIIIEHYGDQWGEHFLARIDSNTGELEIFRKNDWGFLCGSWSCSPNGKYIVDWFRRKKGLWGSRVEEGLGLLNMHENKIFRLMNESAISGDGYRGNKFSWSVDSTKFLFGTGKVYIVSLKKA
jgi:hypothetical protein